MAKIAFQEYSSRAEASYAAAQMLADCLEIQWHNERRASIVVSGGSTPGDCFDVLSKELLPWSDITVIPSDERWVPASHKDSNERLIRERLLQNKAASGQVLSLYRESQTAEDAVDSIETDLKQSALPFGCVLIGMGEDGHFASLFPDFEGLNRATDPDEPALCVPVKTVASPYQRMSLTLSALRQTEQIVLLFFGQAKRHVFDSATDGNTNFPVQKLMANLKSPLTVFWAD